MFPSRSIWMQLARGVVGLVLLYLVLNHLDDWRWWALLPGIAAVASLGGCPLCWTAGLVQTVLNRRSGPACPDGSCENSHNVK
jgi:hypothetical protein